MSSALPLMPFEPATLDDLDQFFEETGVDSKCDQCSNGNYIAIFEFEGSIPIVIFAKQTGEISPDLKIPQILTVCERCGFTKMFSRVVFNKWLLKKAKERDAGNE